MESAHLFAMGIALAWLAGLRVYLTVFGVGLAGALGWIELPPDLAVTASPWVLGTAGTLALVEFATDKIPGVDSVWDLLHTLLRVPAGAFLAAAAMAPEGDAGAGAWLAGGGAALASHLLKSGLRATINTSPEPLSNWGASLGEDAVALTALVFVFSHPWLVLGALLAIGLGLALLLGWSARRILRWWRRPAPSAVDSG